MGGDALGVVDVQVVAVLHFFSAIDQLELIATGNLSSTSNLEILRIPLDVKTDALASAGGLAPAPLVLVLTVDLLWVLILLLLQRHSGPVSLLYHDLILYTIGVDRPHGEQQLLQVLWVLPDRLILNNLNHA